MIINKSTLINLASIARKAKLERIKAVFLTNNKAVVTSASVLVEHTLPSPMYEYYNPDCEIRHENVKIPLDTINRIDVKENRSIPQQNDCVITKHKEQTKEDSLTLIVGEQKLNFKNEASNYPDYATIIPTKNQKAKTVNIDQLYDLVKTLKKLGNDEYKISIENNLVMLYNHRTIGLVVAFD